MSANLIPLTSAGGFSTTGNVTGNFFIGDGSQLTNLPSGGSSLVNGDNSFSLDSSAQAVLTLANANGAIGSFQTRTDAPDILINSLTGNVVLGANDSQEFKFGVDGNISLPTSGSVNFDGGVGIAQTPNADFTISVDDPTNDGYYIFNTVNDTGVPVTQTRVAYDNFTVSTDIPGSNYSWTFDSLGILGLPGNISGGTGVDSSFYVVDDGTNGSVELKTISFAGETLGSNVRVTQNNVTISTADVSHTWTYGNTGTLTLPGNGTVYNNSGVTTVTGNSGVELKYNVVDTGGFVGVDDTSSAYLLSGNSSAASNIVVSLSNVATRSSGNISVTSNNYTWNFDTTGTLTVPYEGIIQSLDDTVILQSKDTGTGNTFSARLGTNGGLYFETTEYPQGWLNLVNNAGNADINAIPGTGGGAGKSININAGAADQTDFYTTPGGNVNITGGLGASNDGGGGGAGGNVNITSGLSADSAGHAGNINITAGTNNWVFDYTGTTTLPTVTSESAKFVGTRKVVGGLDATSPYSVTLSAGGTPTVAYTALAGSASVKVTFAVASNGAGFQWEQFDVVAVPSQDVGSAVNFVVSNRVKGAAAIPDTVVTATIVDFKIVISLTLDASQTSGGTASFDATEFGLMVD